MTWPTTSRRTALTGALLAGAAPIMVMPLASHAVTSAAPKPPLAYTGGTAQVGLSSVVLQGTVNPRSSETSYAFQYGLTIAYGAQTLPAPAGSTTEVKVSQTLTGLQPATVYHYRLVAASSAGTTYGGDRTFSTKPIPLTFKIAAQPNPDVFGSPFSVSGVLSGTGAANHQVVLQSNPFPYLRGFRNTGNPQLTDAGGGFSFLVTGLSQNTQFRVAAVGTPSVNSPAIAERVAVRASLHLRSTGRRGFARLYGAVEPAEVGAHVSFQLLRAGHKPLNVGGTMLKRTGISASRFSRVVRIRRGGLYRAFVQVGNGRQMSGRSRALLIR